MGYMKLEEILPMEIIELISSDVLTMKAFDVAEGGNSDWSVSNIRTWLNSDREIVTYADQPPMASAMAELKNGYLPDNIRTEHVGLEGFGIRPAITVDLRKVTFREQEE